MATVSTGALVALNQAMRPDADNDTGRLIAVQFGCQLVGSYFVGRKMGWLTLGASLTAAAMLIQAFRGYLAVPSTALMGLGLGSVMASVNTLAGLESPPELRIRTLQILNVFWPLGAAFGTWLLAWIAKQSAISPYFTTLALLFLIMAVFSNSRRDVELAPMSQPSQPAAAFPALVSILALLAVGVETGVANWLPSFQVRYLTASAHIIPLATIFWVSILISRMLASRWLQGNATSFLTTAASLAGVGTLGILFFQTPWLLVVFVVITAAAIGPVFPLLLTHAIPLSRRGFVFFCAALGSAVFPWLIGKLATMSHSLRSALLLPSLGSLAIAGLVLFGLCRYVKSTTQSNEGHPSTRQV